MGSGSVPPPPLPQELPTTEPHSILQDLSGVVSCLEEVRMEGRA